MDSMQGKLRKALGAVKDHTSISIAKVAGSAGSPEVEIALVKATSHDETPLEEKYVQELLYLTTSGSHEHVEVCIASMAKRLRKTHNWIVAIKTLMLTHRLLRDGDSAIERELTSLRKRGTRVLNVCAFRDESHCSGWDFSVFVRAYGLYLDERLECPIPSFFPPKSQKSPNNSTHELPANRRHSSASPSASVSDEDGSRIKQHSSHRRRKPVKRMRPQELMQKFPQFQRLLERILACRPFGAAKAHRLVLFALHPLVRESFLVYSDIRDGMAILLDAFFDLEQLDCISAFDIYKKAAKQVDELIAFHSFCKALGVCKATEYPAVEKISEEMLETMAASLRLRLDSARDGNKKSIKTPPPQARSVSFQDELEGNSLQESKGSKAHLAPPYSPRPPTPPRYTANAPVLPKPTAAKKILNDGLNLLDIDEQPAMSSQEKDNKLALALFSGLETRVNTTWESFSPNVSEKDMNGQTSNNVMQVGKGVNGWELALLDSVSDLSRPNPRPTGSMPAGSFDNELLDNLYYQGIEDRIKQAASSGPAGSASSMAVSASHPHSNFLALPAPPPPDAGSTYQTHTQEDPFAASINVLPPAYVQMSELRQKQQLLLQEQQHWLQFQHEGSIFGYGSAASPNQLASNPFAAPFQSTALPISYYGVNSNYV